MRIAIGGFQHETNTFAPSKATFDDFVRGSGWPPLLTGEQIFDGVKGMNLPIAGFIEQMGKTSHKLVPIVWAAASPSAQVTEDAFERISKMLTDGIRAAAPDCVYLDLHGAMVAQHIDDGEGKSCAGCATSSARGFRWWPASTCTPMSPGRCWTWRTG